MMDTEKKGGSDETAAELIRQAEQLEGDRGTLDQHCTEIAERLLPDDKFMFQGLGQNDTEGDKRNQEIYDSTPVLALGRFAAIIDSLLTPRASFWHKLKTNNKTLEGNKQVQDYFQIVNEILFSERYSPRAGFTAQNQLQYISLGAYGTGSMFVDDLYGSPGLRYKNVHLSELYLQQNHQGLVDRVCRRFYLTCREAYQQFGDSLPETILSKLKSSQAHDQKKKYKFLHWVMPRTDYDPFRKDYKGMPYASYYCAVDGQKMLREGGYTSFPYATSRYRQANNEAYGRSIAMDVLPSIKTLNEQKKTLLKQAHLATDPVILTYDDGVVDLYEGTPGSMVPGGVSKDGRSLVQAMPFGRIDIGKDAMLEEKSLINDSFLVSIFQILVEDRPDMTATEVMERAREKGILLAPTVGRQQDEYLGPMLEREIDILDRQGRLPQMPRILREAKGEYTIIYDSPLTRTQKAEWSSGAMRTIESLLTVATATQDPSVLDYINWDVAAPQIAEINGTPATWLNDQLAVNQKRQARAQAMQEQKDIDAAPAMAGMLKAVK